MSYTLHRFDVRTSPLSSYCALRGRMAQRSPRSSQSAESDYRYLHDTIYDHSVSERRLDLLCVPLCTAPLSDSVSRSGSKACAGALWSVATLLLLVATLLLVIATLLGSAALLL